MNARDVSKDHDTLVALSIIMYVIGVYSFVCACIEIIQEYFFNEARQQSEDQEIRGGGRARSISQEARKSHRPGTEVEVNSAEQQGERHSGRSKLL